MMTLSFVCSAGSWMCLFSQVQKQGRLSGHCEQNALCALTYVEGHMMVLGLLWEMGLADLSDIHTYSSFSHLIKSCHKLQCCDRRMLQQQKKLPQVVLDLILQTYAHSFQENLLLGLSVVCHHYRQSNEE